MRHRPWWLEQFAESQARTQKHNGNPDTKGNASLKSSHVSKEENRMRFRNAQPRCEHPAHDYTHRQPCDGLSVLRYLHILSAIYRFPLKAICKAHPVEKLPRVTRKRRTTTPLQSRRNRTDKMSNPLCHQTR